MNILISCNTYFQLISAIQLKLTRFADDEVDLLLSDHSQNASFVAERLKALVLFRSVIFIRSKSDDYRNNILSKAAGAVQMIGRRIDVAVPYDEIVFYNLTKPLYTIITSQIAYNKHLVCAGFDEGILSTGKIGYGFSAIIANKARSALGLEVYPGLKRYYCYFPELYRSNRVGCEVVRIPGWSTTRSELSGILCDVFELDPSPIEQRYIYFCSSSDIDGFSYGETELIKRIADLVGRDNLLVKMHPRDGRRVLQEDGISVMEQSYVPWEAMHACGCADGCTLITATSGAFLSSTAMLTGDAHGVFLIPPLERLDETSLRVVSGVERTLESLHNEGLCPNIETHGWDGLDVLKAIGGAD